MWPKLKYAIAFALLISSVGALADSDAVALAKSAGVIAGAAEACGQPISTMVMRTGEAINALATDPLDKNYATAAFERARQDGYNNMMQSQQLSCPKVINDYNSLPLLQPDYKATVIQPLLARNPAAQGNKPLPPTSPAVPSATLPPPSAATTPTLPSQQIIQPPPTQNYVVSNSNPPPSTTTNANLPPINPAYNGNNAQPQTQNNGQNTEMARLQLAQQLAQMAQTLVSNNPNQVVVGMPGMPSANNPIYNPQLNEQVNGIGANNPIFSGQPLGNK